MKSLLLKFVSAPLSGAVLLGLFASQMFVTSLQADEFTNISDIKGCRAIRGEEERLACYDTVSDGGVFNEQVLKEVQVEEFGSAKMPKPPEKAPVPAPAAAPAATATTAPAPEPSPQPSTKVSTDELAVTIVRMKKNATGYHFFQTEDGQVWKQQNATSWSVSTPFEAIIKKGVFGSFFLVNEGGRSTRVKRVK